MRNLRTGKSGTLDIDILAREPSQLRMELTGSFGVHIASIAMSGDEVQYILTQEKRFVSAPAGADALSRLVPIRIPPEALMAVLFERELPSSEWQCDSARQPIQCRHLGEPIVIRWLEREGRKRRLKIGAAEAAIEMVIDESKSKVEFGPDAFALDPPKGYERVRIPRGSAPASDR